MVTDDEVRLNNPSDDFAALSSFALPIGLEQRMKEMTEQIQQSNHKDAKIAFTEWLFVPGGRPAPGYNNMGGAIDTAGFLNMLLRNSEIVPISDMTGILEFGDHLGAQHLHREQRNGATGRAGRGQSNPGRLEIRNGVPAYQRCGHPASAEERLTAACEQICVSNPDEYSVWSIGSELQYDSESLVN